MFNNVLLFPRIGDGRAVIKPVGRDHVRADGNGSR